MPRVAARGWLMLLFLTTLVGCGDDGASGGAGAGTDSRLSVGRRVQFVGFDASEPLVNAMRQGKLQGLVVQNPYRMGELGVRTLVAHLEKQKVDPKISTGEVLVTPENME